MKDRVLVLYDNRTLRDELVPGWGFSALIERGGKVVLFDVGADVLVFEHNAKACGVDLKATDVLVLSHEHCDHIGAISSALHKNLDVYYPAGFSSQFQREIWDEGKKPLWTPYPVTDPLEIVPGVRSTGELKGKNGIVEQGVIVETGEGPILITGCAHPGIVEMVKVAVDIVGEPMHLVLGGFHLLEKKTTEVQAIAAELKQLGVKHIGPCHCTGDRAIATLGKAFGEATITIKAGSEVGI
jgi:7,8-dihydropterin-6-yl-methyl-4-(beta-D-ribofuranosyl)aminobenzene 5'-phosphate synthase